MPRPAVIPRVKPRSRRLTNLSRAEKVIKFVESLKHTKDHHAGKPFKLEKWQRQFVTRLFSEGADGRRIYREALLFVPRKNGKTDMMAAILLYLFLSESTTETYSISNDQKEAAIIYDRMVGFLSQDFLAPMRRKVRIQNYRYTLLHSDGGKFVALSSDHENKTGFHPSTVVVDEFHEFRDTRALDALITGMGASQHTLLVTTTTAGDSVDNSPCYELYQRAKRAIANPEADPQFLPVVYEAPEGSNWEDEATWKAANPNLGVSVQLEFLRAEYAKAKASPRYAAKFKRFYLNLWCDEDLIWLPQVEFAACGKERIAEPTLDGCQCAMGLDLSSHTDLTAGVAAFRKPDGFVDLLVHAWGPEVGVADRESRDGFPYRMWAAQGLMTLTPGPVVDQGSVLAWVCEQHARFNPTRIAIDRFLASQLRVQIEQVVGADVVYPFPQTFVEFSPACREMERLVLTGKLRHGGNPIMTAAAAGCIVLEDNNGNIRPSKSRSRARIDALVAALMAIKVLADQPAEMQSDLYRGPLLA